MNIRASADREVLGVFAKAPIPGLVKTRLAKEIGPAAAATLYRRMGREVLATAVGASAGRAVTVWYAPARQRTAVREWLSGMAEIQLRAQPAGDLGHRLERAVAHHFEQGAARVVIIGTDCPSITPADLDRAFAALRGVDVVLGPATDGGYYLIGLRAPQPRLFKDIPWSTPQVFRTTVDRLKELGISFRLLGERRDVDTLADATALGLLPAAIARKHPRDG